MIILRLLFAIFIIFVTLTFGLGALLLFKIRFHLQNPFIKQDQVQPPPYDGKTIEGEYKRVDKTPKD